jgi:Flp pilus assembly secretin CpaC
MNLSILLFLNAIALADAPFQMTLGEQKLIQVPSLKSYSIGNPQILEGSRPPFGNHSTIMIRAKREGQTDLRIWKKDGSHEIRWIQIQKNSHSPSLLHAVSQLQEVEISLHPEGSAIIRGEFRTREEGLKIQNLVRLYPGKIENLTLPAPEVIEPWKKDIEKWLSSSQLSSALRLEFISGNWTLSGSIADESYRTRLIAQAEALFPGLLIQLDALPDQNPTLFFKVYLLEIRKTDLQHLGVEWPTSVSLPVAASTRIQALSELQVSIHALQREGRLTILSQPEIAVRVPGEAELFAGGEVPIRQENRREFQITWKNCGVLLKLKTLQTAGKKIRLEIQTEVSHIDSAIGHKDIPGFQTNRLKTQVDAFLDRPLFLSGLLQKTEVQNAKGFPGALKMPILGKLFSSEDFLEDRSELVAVLTPTDRRENIIPNPPPSAPDETVQAHTLEFSRNLTMPPPLFFRKIY